MSEHPTPWKIQIIGQSAHVIDDERNTITNFDPDDSDFWQGIVKAVNSHDALVSLLETAGDFLEDSRSNHVAGSSADEAWDKIRASLLADIGTAVGSAPHPSASSQPAESNGDRTGGGK